jgi:predicted ATPase
MDYIQIEGYKSFKSIKLDLRPINILIGSNGSGKSNFLSFFEFLNNLYEQKLPEYVALNGGEDKFLHHGSKVTKFLMGKISFDRQTNEYSFVLSKGDDGFIFQKETLWYNKDPKRLSNFGKNAELKHSDSYRATYIRRHLTSFKKYHFHDTGKNAPFNKLSRVPDETYFLYEKGDNLAAFLYKIQQESPKIYVRIVKVIQSIAPYFSDFFLRPNTEGYLRLQWQSKFGETVYGATDFSDGTIRFIALTTLFLQPDLPQTLIIDEPELGLHPTAIAKLAGMIKSVASRGTKVIVATQSTDLISHFEPEDIVTVDQKDGETVFNVLKKNDLDIWLNDYSLGDLWKQKIIPQGQP